MRCSGCDFLVIYVLAAKKSKLPIARIKAHKLVASQLTAENALVNSQLTAAPIRPGSAAKAYFPSLANMAASDFNLLFIHSLASGAGDSSDGVPSGGVGSIFGLPPPPPPVRARMSVLMVRPRAVSMLKIVTPVALIESEFFLQVLYPHSEF